MTLDQMIGSQVTLVENGEEYKGVLKRLGINDYAVVVSDSSSECANTEFMIDFSDTDLLTIIGTRITLNY